MNWRRGFGAAGLFLICIALRAGFSGPSAAPARAAGPLPQLMVAQTAPTEVRLKKRGNGHFYVYGMVNGQLVEFLVDSGASGIALTVEDATRVGIPVDRRSWQVIGSGASGAVRGQVNRLDSVEVEGRTVTNLDAMVANGLTISLLGQDFLKHMGSVTMAGDIMVLR